MQVIKNPVAAMQGEGKKYAHYLNFGQPKTLLTPRMPRTPRMTGRGGISRALML